MGTIDLIEKSLDHSIVRLEYVGRITPWDMACTNHGFVPPRDNKEDLRRLSVYRFACETNCDVRPDLIYDHLHCNRGRILRTKGSFLKQTIRPRPGTVNH